MQPIIRQLESGLPHEIQFALNMLLWLTKTWSVPLPKYPRLLPALLANAGLLDPQLWDNMEEGNFWNDGLGGDESLFNTGNTSWKCRVVQVSNYYC